MSYYVGRSCTEPYTCFFRIGMLDDFFLRVVFNSTQRISILIFRLVGTTIMKQKYAILTGYGMEGRIKGTGAPTIKCMSCISSKTVYRRRKGKESFQVEGMPVPSSYLLPSSSSDA